MFTSVQLYINRPYLPGWHAAFKAHRNYKKFPENCLFKKKVLAVLLFSFKAKRIEELE